MTRPSRFPCVSQPPFGVVAEYISKDENFLSEAKVLLEIPTERYDHLKVELAKQGPFLDRPALGRVVKGVLPGELRPEKVAQIIWRFHSILRNSSDEALEEAVSTLKEAIKEHSEGISPEERERLCDRIEDLAVAPGALAQQFKAEQLTEATGCELQDFQFICDIRPIFDDERSMIEGAFPVSTLRLDCLLRDGSLSTFEVRLTEQQIRDFCAKADFAASKLSAIKNLLSEKRIVLPRTSMTVNSED